MTQRFITSGLIGFGWLLGATLGMCQPVQLDFRSFDLPEAKFTAGLGINPEGNLVGVFGAADGSHGFLSSRGDMTTIDAPYGIPGTTSAQGINPPGEIVGLYTDHGTIVGGDKFRTRGYLRNTAGTFTRIDFPGAENTFAIKISPTGQVVGCYHHQSADFDVAHGGTMHGYVYQNGNYESLPVPGTMTNGITRDGQLMVGVVYPTPTEYHAYKVENGVYSLLDTPAYVISSFAWDVNPAGEVVGYYVDSANKPHGFLLSGAEFTTVDFPGANVVATQVRGINPEGDMIGFYLIKDASGTVHEHGFLATRNQGTRNSIILP